MKKVIPIKERFFKHVIKTDSCWEWIGDKWEFGYGVIYNPTKQQNEKAHRVSWEIHNGKIPKNLWVLHKCDNPPCTNPSHLYLGNHKDNVRDAKMRNRYPENHGSKNGNSMLTEEQVSKIKKSTIASKELANRYKVSYQTIRFIMTGITWKHVPS